MLLSCGEQLLGDRPLGEKLALVREAGFDGVDLGWATIAEAAARRVVADDGMAVGAVYSQLRGAGLLARRAGERAAALDRVVERAEGAAAVGARLLIVVPIFGEARLRGFPPLVGLADLETGLLLAALDELAERVAALPVTVAIEPLNRDETHFLTDPAAAAAICAAVGSPRIATMVDSYHCRRNGQDIPAAIAATGERLALVHLSDTERRLPGEGGIDFGPVLAALRRRGYGGWMGLECRPVEEVAALGRSVGYLRGLWAAAGGSIGAPARGDAAREEGERRG